MTKRSQIDWKLLLVFAALIGWGLTTLSFIWGGLSQRVRFADRNEIDEYAEFSLVTGTSLEQIAIDLNIAVPVVGACVYSLDNIGTLLGQPQQAKLIADPYFDRFSTDDHIWRIVFVYQSNDYRILYFDHLSIDSLEGQIGCKPIKAFKWKVDPPKIDKGKPKLGAIRQIEE